MFGLQCSWLHMSNVGSSLTTTIMITTQHFSRLRKQTRKHLNPKGMKKPREAAYSQVFSPDER